jgi:hypothetical protein
MNGEPMNRLDPPATRHDYSIREPAKLVIQVLYLLVSFLPLLIWSIVEEIFFTKPKSVHGKVVMVNYTIMYSIVSTKSNASRIV